MKNICIYYYICSSSLLFGFVHQYSARPSRLRILSDLGWFSSCSRVHMSTCPHRASGGGQKSGEGPPGMTYNRSRTHTVSPRPLPASRPTARITPRAAPRTAPRSTPRRSLPAGDRHRANSPGPARPSRRRPRARATGKPLPPRPRPPSAPAARRHPGLARRPS